MKRLVLIPLVIIVLTSGLALGCPPAPEEDDFCFIATAAYGTPDAEEIDILRQFRDEFLLHNFPGRAFVTVYYTVSPPVAGFISEHDVLRVVVREGFVDPVVNIVEMTENWWMQ